MVMISAENEEQKTHLPTEICDISARAMACAICHRARTKKLPFIDWYLVLRVNENADIYAIRKQYHKLALQLHPDKNKHSKAEAAFKLVSEAYFCLSDTARRATFDYERETISCTKCTNTAGPTSTIKTQKNHHQEPPISSSRIQRRMNELRARLKEEVNIIEKCLSANASSSKRQQPLRNAVGTKLELPVFDPSDYYQQKGTPPQCRTVDHKQMEGLRSWFRMGNRCLVNDKEMSGSPVFENRSGRVSYMSRCDTSTRDRVSFMSRCDTSTRNR